MTTHTKNPAFIGVDVGGTNTTAALALPDGVCRETLREKTDRAGGATAGLACIEQLVERLLSVAAAADLAVQCIGIGFGGPVDADTGVVLLSHHVPGWNNVPLRQHLAERFGLPVRLDNDCNAGTLGEWRYGAGRGAHDLLYVNIGTGIGGGVIANGQQIRGCANGAGEIGHLVVQPDGPACTCGNHGCLEAFCSGPSIARRAREAGFDAEATARDVFARARQRDPLAQQLVDETAGYLARAIGNAVVLLNPERVILGGGVGSTGDVLLEPLRSWLPNYVLPVHRRCLQLQTAQLGYDAGVLGAVALAADREAPARQ